MGKQKLRAMLFWASISRTPLEKRNRRDVYLDEERSRSWQDRSKRFLERRHDTLASLSMDSLYSALAMQHFLDLDAADAARPLEMRCSDDGFAGDISDQFHIDAPRGRYTVAGDVFQFRASPGETEEDFVTRLTQAVRKIPPPGLLGRVTCTISQSGLAALERASLCSIAVSGGQHKVEYTLEADPVSAGLLVTLRWWTSRSTLTFARAADICPLNPSENPSRTLLVMCPSRTVNGTVWVVFGPV